ncbi:MAG: hypothetical protein KF681_17195 [Bdellovibrionaceae bacterium]|nr:hypothetical protein [Pseudobdellovibrionaceae bacterium]
MMKWIVPFILTGVFTLGCSSKVSTLDLEAEEASNSLSKPSASSVESISRQSEEPAETCSSTKNGLRVLVTLNSAEPLKCRDNTRRDPARAVGPACPGGLTISNVTSSAAWVDCTDVQVCGKAPKSKTDLASHPSSRMTQLDFADLPWGCTGDLEWAPADQTANAAAIKKVVIDITPPPCPICTTTGLRTCEICGSDGVPPVIKEVIPEVGACSQFKIVVFAEDKESGLHRDAYSIDAGATWQSSNEFTVPGVNLNLAGSNVRVRDRAGNITQWPKTLTLTAPPCPCNAPWGEKVPHGETRTVFKSATVTCAQTCESVARTCNNGVLSGSADGQFSECKVQGCPKCNLPWGDQIEHGQSVTAFEQPNVTCADQCRSTVLSCDRGNLVGPASTYASKACQFSKPSCNCTFEGSVIAHGGSKTVYATPQVACGETCQPQTVTCNLGNLSGATSSKNLSCTPRECKCTTSWGQKLDLNQEIDAFKSATLACDQSLSCQDAANRIRIKCNNVQTNEITLVQGTGTVADFKQPSCSIPACACEHLGRFLKPTDPPMSVYKIDKAIPPATCKMQGNVGTVRCVKVGANFNVQGDTNTALYKFAACEDVAGGGNSSENVGAGTGGGTGGGVGNDDGEGEGFRRRSKGVSRGCDVNSYPYVCASFDFRTISADAGGYCRVPGTNGFTALPTDINDLSGRIEPKGFFTTFSQKEVACGDSCSRYAKLGICLQGHLSTKDTHPYSDCREVCP